MSTIMIKNIPHLKKNINFNKIRLAGMMFSKFYKNQNHLKPLYFFHPTQIGVHMYYLRSLKFHNWDIILTS